MPFPFRQSLAFSFIVKVECTVSCIYIAYLVRYVEVSNVSDARGETKMAMSRIPNPFLAILAILTTSGTSHGYFLTHTAM
ncbi:hypothetical protein F5Y08DRAFT_301346 [Xylaria arbuscula]|nr:hypothetical protein F5Y08DRAFT_301346 [Xylaria arbuscula]